MKDGSPSASLPPRENALARLALDRLRLRLLSATFRRAFLSTLVPSACVGYFFYQGIALGYLIGWIVLAAASIALRSGFALRYLSAPPGEPGPALRNLVVLSGLVGFLHGAVAIIFLPYISPRDQAVVTMIILCWCAGSIIVGSIAPRAYYAFVTLATTPFAIFWLIYGGDGGAVIAALIVPMFVMVALYTRDAERVLVDSFYLRHQNEDLLRRLELANQRRATFIEFLNHDLRNALGVVGMGLATLSLKSRSTDEQPILDGARQGLEWARGLIDALDELAQLDAGVPVRPERVVLADLAATTRRTFASAAGEKSLALTSTAPATAVLVDRRLLNRVLQNLVDNAIKYTPQGAVAVRGSCAAGQLVWEVEDTGPGIPAAERERVFDEFYQIDNPERAHAKGRGLGLSVVRRFVALMGGTVAVDRGAHAGRGL